MASDVVIKRFLKGRTLTTMSTSFFVCCFVVSLIVNMKDNAAMIVSRLFKTGRCRGMRLTFSSFFVFVLIKKVVLSVTKVVFTRPIFHLAGAPRRIVPRTMTCFHVCVKKAFLFMAFGDVVSVLQNINRSIHPVLFVLVAAILGVTFSLLFVLMFG